MPTESPAATIVAPNVRSMRRARLVLAAMSLLLAIFVYFIPNDRFPNSADDWSYLFQARLFASGQAYAEDALYDKNNPLQRYLGTNCVDDYRGRRFSKYPPGWPVLLAVGSAVRVEWLVGPLLGALLVFLVLGDVERRVGAGWVTRAWLLLALSAFFTYTFQSFRSHTATMLCLFAAFLAYGDDETAERPPWRALASGALVGYASLVRYVDWIPLALWITWDLLRRRRIAHLALFAVAFGLIAGLNLLYDGLLSGNPFLTPTTLERGAGLHDRLVASWRGFAVTGIRLGAVLYAFPPVMVLLARSYWKQSRMRVNARLFLMSVVVYFFYVGAIGGPGPRYLASYFPFLVVAAVDGWRWLLTERPARARLLWKSAIALQILASIVFAGIEIRRVHERQDLARTVAEVGPGKQVVIMKTGPRGETWADFTRNPAVLSSADVLYFGWGDGVGLERLIGRFPGRRVFVYEYPGRIFPIRQFNHAP